MHSPGHFTPSGGCPVWKWSIHSACKRPPLLLFQTIFVQNKVNTGILDSIVDPLGAGVQLSLVLLRWLGYAFMKWLFGLSSTPGYDVVFSSQTRPGWLEDFLRWKIIPSVWFSYILFWGFCLFFKYQVFKFRKHEFYLLKAMVELWRHLVQMMENLDSCTVTPGLQSNRNFPMRNDWVKSPRSICMAALIRCV